MVLPNLEGLRIACCSRNHKRAALLFDWVSTATTGCEYSNEELFPPDIIGTDKDIGELAKRNEHDKFQAWKYFEHNNVTEFDLSVLQSVHRDFILLEVARLCRQQGAQAAVLDLANPGILAIGKGSDEENVGYVAALKSIPVAIDDKLSWEHVREFRRDNEAVRKYRDLHLWIETGLKAKSESHARELIEQRISDYEWSIRKHGIETKSQVLTSLFGIGAITTTIGSVASTAAALGPLYGTLAGAGVAVSGTVAWIQRRRLALEDVKRGPFREVAYLYDVKNKFD